jgi:hypothetical protein
VWTYHIFGAGLRKMVVVVVVVGWGPVVGSQGMGIMSKVIIKINYLDCFHLAK